MTDEEKLLWGTVLPKEEYKDAVAKYKAAAQKGNFSIRITPVLSEEAVRLLIQAGYYITHTEERGNTPAFSLMTYSPVNIKYL